MKMLSSALSSMVATSYMTRGQDKWESETFVLVNLNLNSNMQPKTTESDGSAALAEPWKLYKCITISPHSSQEELVSILEVSTRLSQSQL